MPEFKIEPDIYTLYSIQDDWANDIADSEMDSCVYQYLKDDLVAGISVPDINAKCINEKIELLIPGSEDPLVAGIVDFIEQNNKENNTNILVCSSRL